jgi:hypothetical protein
MFVDEDDLVETKLEMEEIMLDIRRTISISTIKEL